MREVVGVALLDARRVLAARRAFPSHLAGSWELPGGKVEPGEDPAATAVREIAEELGCGIEVTGWLEGESRIEPSGRARRDRARAPHRHGPAHRRRSGARRARRRALAASRPARRGDVGRGRRTVPARCRDLLDPS